jgi:hypothetical protein
MFTAKLVISAIAWMLIGEVAAIVALYYRVDTHACRNTSGPALLLGAGVTVLLPLMDYADSLKQAGPRGKSSD